MKRFFRPIILVGIIFIFPCICTFGQAINIGAKYGGGIIFYIDETGQHGLIAAASDQGGGSQWGCNGNSVGGTGGAIGKGKTNTANIVSGCSDISIASRICYNLDLNGFKDWFLPSKGELNQMFIKKTVIGGFTNEEYWSSTEYDIYTAWIQNFTSGHQERSAKNNLKNVRPVRAF